MACPGVKQHPCKRTSVSRGSKESSMPTGRRRQGGLRGGGHARGPSSNWVRQPIWQFRRSASHCLTSTPSFTSLELAPLRSSSCHHVAQCPNIYNSLWQAQGGREEIVNHPPPPSPYHTQTQPLPRASPPGVSPISPSGLGVPGLLAPEAAAGGPARNASCSKVWSIRVTAKSGATVLPRDKNTSSRICIEHLPALGWTLNTIKNRELTTHQEHG